LRLSDLYLKLDKISSYSRLFKQYPQQSFDLGWPEIYKRRYVCAQTVSVGLEWMAERFAIWIFDFNIF